MSQTDQHIVSFNAGEIALKRNSTQSAARLPVTRRIDRQRTELLHAWP